MGTGNSLGSISSKYLTSSCRWEVISVHGKQFLPPSPAIVKNWWRRVKGARPAPSGSKPLPGRPPTACKRCWAV